MKTFLVFVIVFVCACALTCCAVKKGCPSDGRNVGAEKLLSGDPKAMKDVKKAKKFRGGGFY